MSKNIGIALCLLFSVVSVSLYAKDGIKIYGTYKVNGGDTGGVQIRLLRNGINEASNISGDGKFAYDLKFDNQYELSFSKAGYITKKVVISTDVPERVLDSNSDFPPFKIEVELFRQVENVDYSIFDEPVAMVIYDKELDDFDFDRAYNAEVEEEIKAVEAEIVQAPAKPKVDEDLLQYQALIKKADSEFDAKSYVAARKTYDQALYIKPTEQYPKTRIELIDRILADLAKREKQKELDVTYYALIDKADLLFDEKKYSQARSYYVEATEVKPNQQHPKDRIKLIDQIFAERTAEQRAYDNRVALGDKYFQEENYEPARKAYEDALAMRKDETYPKEQIARIYRLLADLKSKKEQENNYNKLIQEADNFFTKENWADARNSYEKASDILPDKRYPKDRIKEIDKLLKSQQKELDQYTDAIERGDALFTKEDWESAQEYYQKALKIKSEEVYPKEQIKKIGDKLADIAAQTAKDKAYKEAIDKADRAFDRQQWEDAKEQYFTALKAKPEETYPKDKLEVVEEKLAALRAQQAKDNEYNEKLKKADVHYDQKDWNAAIAQYKAASELKPSENYPKAQIKKVERFLQEELEKQNAQEREDKYNNYIAEGDAAYKAEDWDKALTNYEGALQIKPTSNYPKNQIEAIARRRKEIAKAEELQKAYDKSIAEADALFNNSEWLPAIAMYDKALDSKPNEAYPKSQKEKAKANISAEELAKAEALKAEKQAQLKKAYDEVIALADKEFADERYSFAKQQYRKAMSILPSEQYPKDKLKEIDELFKQKAKEENQYYKKVVLQDSIKSRYYKRIEPKPDGKQRYVKIIDVTKSSDARFEEFMKKAQQAEAEGNYAFAKAYYRRAYLEKPTIEVQVKLRELDGITSQRLKEISE